ncbi:polyhydroxyalkanoate depolymerase [Capsulimonas corticalis]|uniref:Polyhydroxyalkanoate depolymerase n=1 Tax=Capsulimonas corticalis TaxID=2219043 RepID=A0A402CPI8_9BACT|nr:Clp1/GlmU family protein [Capsulimonas corticalis]BDI33027.1 polyhydroxyalkanoate depolymerase [Capsulimonas corticalis]
MTETPIAREDLDARLDALPAGSAVLLIGGVDTGKSTFVRETLLRRYQAGASVGVLDCDLGQGDVGPPGTVSAAITPAPGSAELRGLRGLDLIGSYFVGANNPTRHVLDISVGACQMMRVLRKRRPDLILIDTCGHIRGNSARELHRRAAELLLPQVIVAFERDAELAPMLAPFRRLQSPEIWTIAPGADVGRKTSAARATSRAARFQAALLDSKEIAIAFDDADLIGTWLGAGVPMQRHLIQFLSSSLQVPIMHAETLPGGALYIVAQRDGWDTSELAGIESTFKTRSLTIVAAQMFAGLLVGLVDSRGVLLDLGTIARIDFERRILTIRSHTKRPAAIAQVWFGRLRLQADGREIGEVPHGNL